MVKLVQVMGDAPESAPVFSVHKTEAGCITGTPEFAERLPLGLPVQEALARTIFFCEKHGIPELYLRDPDQLWPRAAMITG